ncbi:MAG: 2-oxo-4-hydroxy-4-carboxy-5-ureidoimidazoline decarboxylase [Pseudomonadota bacterium]
MTLEDVNGLSADAFVEHFGGIAEHSPWVAETAMTMRPYTSMGEMAEAFGSAIRNAPDTRQLDLLNAHPDLAGRAARAGGLTDASTSEQASAGLDQLTEKEFEAFHRLNEDYKAKFGFPFILAVKGATKAQILNSYAERVEKTRESEYQMAIEQVAKIVRFRLEDAITP